MSLMRDSETQEIKKGSLVGYHGAPAVRSVLWKNHPETPFQHWWIHPVAVKAIKVAEKISLDSECVFTSTTRTSDVAGFQAARAIDHFVEYINKHCRRMGLAPIEDKIRPHKFRRTMAVVIGQQPGAELALGIILKHAATRALANTVSRGYSRADEAWARHFETDRADAAGKYVDDWLSRPQALRAVSGVGATSFNETFDAVQDAARALPTVGDKSDLRALLVQRHPNFRAGPLNFCLGDITQAACLSSTARAAGHEGVDPLKCAPATCSQSVITPEQMPIWLAEEQDLKKMLRQPKVSTAAAEALNHRLHEVQSITKPDQKATRARRVPHEE